MIDKVNKVLWGICTALSLGVVSKKIMQILVCKSELLCQFDSIKQQMPMEDMSQEIHWREVSLKHKEEVREEAGGAFHLYCRLDSWDRRAGRKEHWLGRASDCSAVLKKLGPGCWGALERTLLVRRVACSARPGQRWYPLCAQSVAGSSPGEPGLAANAAVNPERWRPGPLSGDSVSYASCSQFS